MARATPFELVFQRAAESSFPRIAASLAAAGRDPSDRDAFLMDPEVVTLLRDLRPDDGIGEAMDQMVALVHHAWLAWAAGKMTISITREAAEGLLAPQAPDGANAKDVAPYYAQFPERMVWATVIEHQAPEPLDGVYVYHDSGETLRVLGIFGIRPDRPGFSAVEAGGSRPIGLSRDDCTPLFAPTLPGADAARLRSIAGEEELLELGWRTQGLAAAVGSAEGGWRP